MAEVTVPNKLVIKLSGLCIRRLDFIEDIGQGKIVKRRIVMQSIYEDFLNVLDDILQLV
jgi:hypothetical protein